MVDTVSYYDMFFDGIQNIVDQVSETQGDKLEAVAENVQMPLQRGDGCIHLARGILPFQVWNLPTDRFLCGISPIKRIEFEFQWTGGGRHGTAPVFLP